MKEDCGINWKIVEMNLKKVTDLNFAEQGDRGTRKTMVNYNERALADRAYYRIPKVVLLTAPIVTQEMSIPLANTIKEKEVIELLDSDNESIANLLEVCGDASIVDLTGLVDSNDSLSDLTGMVNSNDDFSDDESFSYENEEFMSKGLWIAGQETVQKTAPKSTYVRFPKTSLGLSGEQVKMCIEATEYWYKKYMDTIIVKGLESRIDQGSLGFKEIQARGSGRYDMEIPAFEKDECSFLNSPEALWMPYVRKFLSNQNVVLIHKGVILSTTNSARQVYHSDGIHLAKVEHKPCYAFNVFFYLVDINENNGGTEFYIGSHKCGKEDKIKSMVSSIWIGAKLISLYYVLNRISFVYIRLSILL